MKNPYVSFIVIGRNDDYGYRFLYRVQRFIDNLIYLCEKYELFSELIFVEWNHPKNKKHLWEVLKFKKNRKWLRIRFIIVPNRIHKSLKGPKNLPLLEFVGKNVGIRRANSEYVICTNPDILFNEGLIRFLSKKELSNKFFYKVDRYNLKKDIPEKFKQDKLFNFCRKNYSSLIGYPMNYYKNKISFIKEIILSLRQISKYFLYKLISTKKYRELIITDSAPGDFTLMSKKAWFKLKGYPEKNIHGCIDLYGVVMAGTFLNIRKLRNPLRIYHQFHPPAEGRPVMDKRKIKKDIDYMFRTNKIITFNDDNWGLKDFKLKEKVL